MKFRAGITGYNSYLVDESVDHNQLVVFRFNVKRIQQPVFTHHTDARLKNDVCRWLRCYANQLVRVEEQLEREIPPRDMVLTTYKPGENPTPVGIPYLHMVINQLHNDNVGMFVTDGTPESDLVTDIPARVNACVEILKDLCAIAGKQPTMIYYAVVEPKLEEIGMVGRIRGEDVTAAHLWGCNGTIYKGEVGYLTACINVMNGGIKQANRTAVKTKKLLGGMFQYDCDKALPIFTHKKLFTKGVIIELLWFLAGETDATLLQEQGVHIWDGNSDRAFLDKKADNAPTEELRREFKSRREGDCGPVYGYNWSFFGRLYGEEIGGFDQLRHVILSLRKRKSCILASHNPENVDQCVLPACHQQCVFTITDGDRLNCTMTQRSADMGLGVPFNVGSYTILMAILANICGLRLGKFYHLTVDTHVYVNQENSLMEACVEAARGGGNRYRIHPGPELKLPGNLKELPTLTFSQMLEWYRQKDLCLIWQKDVKRSAELKLDFVS